MINKNKDNYIWSPYIPLSTTYKRNNMTEANTLTHKKLLEMLEFERLILSVLKNELKDKNA